MALCLLDRSSTAENLATANNKGTGSDTSSSRRKDSIERKPQRSSDIVKKNATRPNRAATIDFTQMPTAKRAISVPTRHLHGVQDDYAEEVESTVFEPNLKQLGIHKVPNLRDDGVFECPG